MPKQLKKWNGRIWIEGKQSKCNIAAYSQKQAADLLTQASGVRNALGEIKIYFSPTWGNSMNGITPEEPCLYVEDKLNDTPPKRIL